jgi:N-acetylglucosamine-6-phosphate deacetylase
MHTDSILIRGALPDSAQIVDIVAANGRIRAVRRRGKGAPDIGGDDAIIAPPLFDIQVNGAGGIDLQRSDLTVSHVAALNAYLVGRGVLRWIPTLVTDAPDALEHRCRVLAAAMADPALARHMPGIHLEGPHIAEDDGPRGAHPRAHVLPPDLRLFNRLYKAATGKIAYVTLAPETRGALKFIRALSDRGVTVALGHHGASEKQITAAVAAGARLCTHLGNGMAPMVHRHHNALWPQLADDRLHASLIADLEHVPPAMLRVIARAKGAERLVLVSDSVFLAGMKPGRYEMFGAAVEMKRSGRVCLAGTELLAGSSLSLLNGVWNLHHNTDVSLAEAFDAASRNPARLLNVALPPWPPKPEQPAELLVCRQTAGPDRPSGLTIEAVLY